MGGKSSKPVGCDGAVVGASASDCVRRRLEFAKLLHGRLCPVELDGLLNGDVADHLSQYLVLCYPAWGERGIVREGQDKTASNSGDEARTGWGGTRIYLASPPLQSPLVALHVACKAVDQGWGNTGHSRMQLVLYRPKEGRELSIPLDHDAIEDDAAVHVINLGCVNHEAQDLELECQLERQDMQLRYSSKIIAEQKEDVEHVGGAAAAAVEAAETTTVEAAAEHLCRISRAGDVLAVVMCSAPYGGFECICTMAAMRAVVCVP